MMVCEREIMLFRVFGIKESICKTRLQCSKASFSNVSAAGPGASDWSAVDVQCTGKGCGVLDNPHL